MKRTKLTDNKTRDPFHSILDFNIFTMRCDETRIFWIAQHSTTQRLSCAPHYPNEKRKQQKTSDKKNTKKTEEQTIQCEISHTIALIWTVDK